MGSLWSSKLFLSSLTLLLFSLCLFTKSCNALANLSSCSGEGQVYIVYTERPPTSVDIESFYVKTLASLLGSEEAAKKALIYVYKVLIGFSAKLTPCQAIELSKRPGVLVIVPSRTYHLDEPGLRKEIVQNVDTFP